jgi:hypothetical protein
MTMTEPLPDTAPWGLGNWTNFQHNWRDMDAEWLQGRSILRFQTNAQRDAMLPSPETGQVIYNEATDRLELRLKTGTWARQGFLPQNLAGFEDDVDGVGLSHNVGGVGANPKGVRLTPTEVQITADAFRVLTDTFKVDATGVTIKSGTNIAVKMTTDATGLVLDGPVKAEQTSYVGSPESVAIDASGKEVKAGTLTVATIVASAPGVVSAAGRVTALDFATTGPGPSTLHGVSLAGGVITGELRDEILHAYGDANKGYVKGFGKAGLIEVDDNVTIKGTKTVLESVIEETNAVYPKWVFSGVPNTISAHVIYSATDPGATNFPEGTIWIS